MSRVDAVDRLDAQKLAAALQNRRVGNRIVVLQETTSTNDVLAQLAPENAEGLVVMAELQTAARGQYGRRWHSASHKGLWLSVLLRPRIPVSESARLTDLLAQTIAATISEFIDEPSSIKPPNDVYIGTRKVAGVLVEMRVESGGSYCAIAGIGVNVNHMQNDFPMELRETAGSLAMAAGHPVDRHAFAVALLRNLDARYRRGGALSEPPAAASESVPP